MDFINALKEIGIENQESREYSLEERCELLGITDVKKDIEKLEFLWCTIDLEGDTHEVIAESENLILVDDIIGVARSPIAKVENWIELLGHLHKKRNFDAYEGKEQFERYMLSDRKDVPIVYEFENNYYVAGEGKHRVTISKCLGLDKIKAKIYHVE